MTLEEIEQLRPFATRYVWWKTAEEALRYPERVVAHVMTSVRLRTFNVWMRLSAKKDCGSCFAMLRRDSSMRAHGTTGIIVSVSPVLERYPPCRSERPVDAENADLFENSPAGDRG
jgi:hypothetical protein